MLKDLTGTLAHIIQISINNFVDKLAFTAVKFVYIGLAVLQINNGN